LHLTTYYNPVKRGYLALSQLFSISYIYDMIDEPMSTRYSVFATVKLDECTPGFKNLMTMIPGKSFNKQA
jgi:hypothetical protein